MLTDSDNKPRKLTLTHFSRLSVTAHVRLAMTEECVRRDNSQNYCMACCLPPNIVLGSAD